MPCKKKKRIYNFEGKKGGEKLRSGKSEIMKKRDKKK